MDNLFFLIYPYHSFCFWGSKFHEPLVSPLLNIKGAYSLHTPILELVRIIKYRVSIGEWNIYYCPVVPIGCLKHILTWHFHGLSQICWWQVCLIEKYGNFRGCLFLLHYLAACFQVFRGLSYICVIRICMDSAWCQVLSIQICNLI